MGFRGKNKLKRGKGKQRGPQKQRKTYSLYGNKRRNNNDKFSGKRKTDDDVEERKRQKVEDVPQRMQQEESSSESEEEIENHLKLLRDAFGNNSKKLVAIESSEESDNDSAILENDSLDHLSDKNDENSEEETENDTLEGKNEDAAPVKGKVLLDAEIVEEENEIDVDTQKEDEQTDSVNDPFSKRLFYDISDSLLSSLQSIPVVNDVHDINWPEIGKINIQIPKCEDKKGPIISSVNITEERPNAPSGTVPICIDPHKEMTLSDLYIKSQIACNVRKVNKSLKEINDGKLKLPFTPLQSELFSILNNYQDLYFTNRTFNNSEEICFIYCLHIVNHILKTRTKVLHHNARLCRKDDIPEEFRDQGLVRPKVIEHSMFIFID